MMDSYLSFLIEVGFDLYLQRRNLASTLIGCKIRKVKRYLDA